MAISQEAFTGPQLFAFAFKKEVISSWDVGLDRPQTTGRDSVGSELAQYKPSCLAYMNLPHLGLIYCRLYKHTTTVCSVLDTAVYLEGLGGQASSWGYRSLLDRVHAQYTLMGEAVCIEQ